MRGKTVIFTVVLSIFSVITGLVLLYSAWAKVQPIELFEYNLAESVHFPWVMAAIASRLLVGVEAAMGFLLVIHFYGNRKWVLKFALTLLVAFSIYLIYLWATSGNNINCGCFGDRIWMSPSASLIKNLVLMVIILLLLRYKNGIRFRYSNLLTTVIFSAVTTLPFILFAIPDQKPNWLKTGKYQLKLDELYSDKSNVPSVELRKGKHIIAFLSYTCPHCRRAAHKMHIMQEKNPSLPFYFFLLGAPQWEASFWKETKASDIPHTHPDENSFFKLAGFSLPVIYWVNDGWVEAKTISYPSLSQVEIEAWLAKQ